MSRPHTDIRAFQPSGYVEGVYSLINPQIGTTRAGKSYLKCLLRDLTDESVLVSEDDVRACVRRLALRDKIVAEPSGALALAAALATSPAGAAACIVTGGSIDADKLAAMLVEGG